MKYYQLSFLFLFFSFFQRISSKAELASTPPRGWNSYDSFCWTISEEEFLNSAEIVSQRLLPHGYEYVVIDYLWYRRKVPGAYVDSHGFDVIDEWGRVIPDLGRWPSSKGGKGFTEVAKKVHSMGLKFGIHVMSGISVQAYEANTPILDINTGGAYGGSGRQWRAQDIGIKKRACAWMPNGFMSVNMQLEAGRAFIRSLYRQYADWGVDFVKNDCIFGDDLRIDEIRYVSEVLRELERPILYSLSPGTSVSPTMAKEVLGLVNMYRITGDDWDTWRDVQSHFEVTSDFANAKMIGAEGLKGKSWPDLDMLPLGSLTDPGSNEGPHRACKLSPNEQRTQITLWAMAKSPLMFGGDVRNLDNTTYNLITNPTVLEINSYSSNNIPFPYIRSEETRSNSPRKYLQEEASKRYENHLGLVSCNDSEANGWSVKNYNEDLEQICWEKSLGKQGTVCLYKRRPILASYDEQMISGEEEHNLFATDRMEVCLDASSGWKRTSKEVKTSSFSPCKGNANQLWQLINNGALVSSYSGLCAVTKSIKVADGIRSWIATGRRGEIYVAFFNLNPETLVIFTEISDIAKSLGRFELNKVDSWKVREVWSGKNFVVHNDNLSSRVESHGCSLFVLELSNK